ncbi:MAG: AAA family ATPase [Planctomycetota bacterium]
MLIGANGAGKSNFVSFFSLLNALVNSSLKLTIAKAGGANAHLYLGSKISKYFEAQINFGPHGYGFKLEPTVKDDFVFASEVAFTGRNIISSTTGGHETELEMINWPDGLDSVRLTVFNSMKNMVVYHFHNTSETAPARNYGIVNHNEKLARDAGNIAAFLLKIKTEHPATYRLIRDTIRMVTPFFDDFNLRENTKSIDVKTTLEWKQKGSDYPFQPSQLSDGTLRFICLTVALLQPNLPATIVIDEPELGLHPYALGILAGLIKKASAKTQVIVSTQSVSLLDHFQPEDVIVVDRKDGASTFERLKQDELSEWLEDYTLGDLWQRNYLNGGPVHE